MKKGNLELVATVLLIVGGINWGLFGVLNIDLVQKVLGSIPILSKLTYALIGLSALTIAYVEFVK